MLLEKLILKKNFEIDILKEKIGLRQEDKRLLIEKLKYVMDDLGLILEEISGNLNRVREFTMAQVANYNGKDGRLSYIVIGGAVYDITNVKEFTSSKCNFVAGTDGTNEFFNCLGGDKSILNKLRVVGVLVE